MGDSDEDGIDHLEISAPKQAEVKHRSSGKDRSETHSSYEGWDDRSHAQAGEKRPRSHKPHKTERSREQKERDKTKDIEKQKQEVEKRLCEKLKLAEREKHRHMPENELRSRERVTETEAERESRLNYEVKMELNAHKRTSLENKKEEDARMKA